MEDTSEYTCYTAPGMVFATEEEMREHYKSDWHRYNLKRKVAGLKPVSKEQYEKHIAAQREAEEAQERGKGRRNKKDKQQKTSSNPSSKAAYYERTEGLSAEAVMDDKIQHAEEFTVCHDLFSRHVSKSLEDNVKYMAKQHGFTVPYIEYLINLEGLINYLGEKVYVANIALFSGRQFHSTEAVQAHMVSKGQCKFEFEGNEDEYAAFYDMDALASNSPLWEEVEVSDDSDDEAIEEGEEGQAEAMEEVDEEGRKVEYITTAIQFTGIPNTGDATALVVNGHEIGHRSMKKYYRQKPKPQVQQHESIRQLMLQYQQMGVINATPRAGPGLQGPHSEVKRPDSDQAKKNMLRVQMANNKINKKHYKAQYIQF